VNGSSGPAVARSVERRLRARPDVAWAAVEPALGRIVVAFDPGRGSVPALLEDIEAVEQDIGVAGARFPLDRPEHPGDAQVRVRHLVAIAANGVGLGWSLSGRLLQSTPLPVELASLFSLVENEPRLRQLIESYFGSAPTDIGLALGNALAQGLAQGPLGLLTDSVHRLNLLLEAGARRQAFERAEADRWGDGSPPLPRQARAQLLKPPAPRPRSLPAGPVERYADGAVVASVATAVGTTIATGSPRRGTAMVVAGIPKASRLGRDAFAAHLARSLTARELVILNDRVLRRLDRVDTLVVDDAVVHTGRAIVTGVRPLNDTDPEDIHQALSRLFDPHHAGRAQREGVWELGPMNEGERRRLAVRRAQLTLVGDDGLVLRRRNRPVAVVGYDDEVSVAAQQVMQVARRQGKLVVLVGDDRRLADRVGAHLLLDRSRGSNAAVRGLQADGCVVAFLANGGTEEAAALRAADVGIEVPAADGSAWSGDVIVNGVADALYILDAIGSAHEVSRQGVALALSGSAMGSLLAVSGDTVGAARRAARAVNVAAMAGMANGYRAARALHRRGGDAPVQPTEWHSLQPDEVLRRLNTSPEGLSEAQVHERERAGETGVPRPSLWGSLTSELINPLTPVLAGGAAASAAVGSVTDAAMVAGVTLLNAVIGGAQRFNAERALHELGRVTTQPVLALRDGDIREVASDDLVPGDVITLQAGDAVLADCRLLEAEDLEVDESALTGESEPVSKDPAPLFSSVVAERSSMLHEGTTIAAGRATAVVVAVGSDTVASGMGANVLGQTVAEGVEGRLRHLTKVTLPVSLAGGAAMLGSGLLRRQPLNQSVSSSVALAVAAVPEGLPLLATMAQLASARRLSTRGALARNPRAVEALGRVSVLCTDKTGTLTEGRIRLQLISDGNGETALTELDASDAGILATGLRASPPEQSGSPLPHHTDQAVLDGASRAGVSEDTGRPGWTRVGELPFEPGRGYHVVAGRWDGGTELSIKGAPELVLPRCTWQGFRDERTRLSSRDRKALTARLEELAARGLRILAVAEGAWEDDDDGEVNDDDIQDLSFLGFLALSDRVRPTAADAVADLSRAGVQVVMVTGDHPGTAQGIAKELGILNEHRALTGTDLADMSDAALDEIVGDVSVFARVTPADKVRIVASLQRNGLAVAMTGDGSNDAPAIRMADAGIALGTRATPAAREAADLVVTDDRIETIVNAITEGRAMWSSVREALAILLGGNLGEIAFTVVSTLLTGQTPLSARQLLAVNLLTDVAPALAIAVRPPARRTPEELIEEGPDASLGRSLERTIAIRGVTTASGAGAAWVIGRFTGGPRRASTMALVALVGSQLGQTLVGGGLDPLVIAAGAGSMAVLAGIVQTPGVSQFFDCQPLDPVAWGVATGAAAGATVASALGSKLLTRLPPPADITEEMPAEEAEPAELRALPAPAG
jgi:cation-transporting P-type ATPase I